MSDQFFIRIDLDLIALRMTASDPMSLVDVRHWLYRQGIIEWGDGWLCESTHLNLFSPNEVVAAVEHVKM